MKVIFIEVSDELKETALMLAAERGLSVSAYVREILFEKKLEYLKRRGVKK